MTIEVVAPDGTVIEFPDGTPPETMKRVMRENFGPQSHRAAAAAQPEPASGRVGARAAVRYSTPTGVIEIPNEAAPDVVRRVLGQHGVEFPAGTSIEVMRRVMQRDFGTPQLGGMGTATGVTATPQPEPEGPSLVDQAVRGLRIGSQGVGRGVGDLLGLPGDLVQMAGNVVREGSAGAVGLVSPEAGQTVRETLGAVPNPLPTSDELKAGAGDTIRHFFGDDALIRDEDMTSSERFAQSINEFGTEGMLGSAAAIRSAGAKAADAVTPAGEWAQRLVSPGTREAARRGRAGSTFVGDTLVSSGAGAGHQAYQESGASDFMRANTGDFGDMLGAMISTFAGGTTLGAGKSLFHAGGRVAAKPAARVGSDLAEMVGLKRFDGPREEFIDPATGKPFGERATRVASNFMQSPRGVGANKATAALIDESLAEMRSLGVSGEAMPTVGQLVGGENIRVPMLEAHQRQIHSVPFVERDQALQQEARSSVVNIARGQPGGGAGRSFTDAFEAEAQRRRSEAQTGAEQAQRGIEQRADQRIRTADEEAEAAQRAADEALHVRNAASGQLRAAGEPHVRERANREIDAAVTGELTAAQRQRSALYDEMARRFGGEQVPLEPIQRILDDMLAETGPVSDRASRIPSDVVGRVRALRELDEEGNVVDYGSTSVRDLNELQVDLRRREDQARAAQDFTMADNISTLRRAVRASVQAFGEASGNPELRALSQRIQEFETEEFGPRFRTGEADRFRRDFNTDRDRQGRAAVSQTTRRFIQAGQPEKVEALRRMMGQARLQGGGEDAIRGVLISDLVGSGIIRADGSINAAKAERWINRFGEETLQAAAPGLVNDIRNMLSDATGADLRARTAQEAAADARASGRTRIRQVESDLRSEIRRVQQDLNLTLGEIDKGALGFALGKDPENAVAEIFSSGDPQRAMRGVVAEVGDNQQVRDGLKQAVREYLLRATNADQGFIEGRPLSQARLDNLMQRHAGTLAEVFSENEMHALRRAHTMLRNQGLVKNIRALTGAPTASQQADRQRIQDAIEGFVKLKYGMLQGGGIIRSLRLLARSVPRDTLADVVDRMLTQAMLDPELAKMLMTKDIPKKSPQWDRRLLSILSIQGGNSEGAE